MRSKFKYYSSTWFYSISATRLFYYLLVRWAIQSKERRNSLDELAAWNLGHSCNKSASVLARCTARMAIFDGCPWMLGNPATATATAIYKKAGLTNVVLPIQIHTNMYIHTRILNPRMPYRKIHVYLRNRG